MDFETRVTLLERDMTDIKEAVTEFSHLKESVALLNHSVELLNRVVWGVLTCVGSTFVIIIINKLIGVE